MIITGYIGSGDSFAEALAEFGCSYADQTDKDWQDLRKALGTGRSSSAKARPIKQ